MKKNTLNQIGIIYSVLLIILVIFQIQIYNWNQINSGSMEKEIEFLIIVEFIGIVTLVISILLWFSSEFKLSNILGILGVIIPIFPLIFTFQIIENYRPDDVWLNYDKVENTYISLFIFAMILLYLILTLNILSPIFSKKGIDELPLIKKTILDLGTKYTRLEIKEISETCGVDKKTIINVANDMIKNNEIYGQYFKSSNSIVFNQQANIDEIDKLMLIYQEWENKQIGKK